MADSIPDFYWSVSWVDFLPGGTHWVFSFVLPGRVAFSKHSWFGCLDKCMADSIPDFYWSVSWVDLLPGVTHWMIFRLCSQTESTQVNTVGLDVRLLAARLEGIHGTACLRSRFHWSVRLGCFCFVGLHTGRFPRCVYVRKGVPRANTVVNGLVGRW